MNIFKRVYRDENGEELPDLRDKSLDQVEFAFKIIGGIFTVCFPLAVGLLWNMSSDMHTISEKMVEVSTTQKQQVNDTANLQSNFAQLLKQHQDLLERIAIIETKIASHEIDDKAFQARAARR